MRYSDDGAAGHRTVTTASMEHVDRDLSDDEMDVDETPEPPQNAVIVNEEPGPDGVDGERSESESEHSDSPESDEEEENEDEQESGIGTGVDQTDEDLIDSEGYDEL